MWTRTLLAAFLIFFIPISNIWTTRWLKQSTDPAKKVKAYASTILVLWIASLIVWITEHPGFFYGVRHEDIVKGLAGSNLAYGAALGLIVGLLAQAVLIRRNPRLATAAKKQMKKLDFFFPFTRRERSLFVLVSITAGICEETLYRGFLYHYFRDTWHWGLWVAVLSAAVVFGLAHGYQGISGILATGAIGAFLAVLYLGTGSLLVPMAFHALLNLRILLFPLPNTNPPQALATGL